MKRVKSTLFTLVLSHGTGLRLLGLPQKARYYFLLNLILIDIPILILGGAIVVHKQDAHFFSGVTLIITEYVVNILLIVVLPAIPVVRIFEFRALFRN